MPISNYPNGFSAGLNVRGLPVLNTYAGKVFWVDSGAGSNGNKGTFDRPFSTIDYAVGQCTANNGDIIFAKPGHTETVTAAAGLDLDVAGITIVFMGNDNDRARVNFTTVVGADMDVDAADITLINPRFTAGIDALTGPIDVNAARFTIVNGLWEDGTTINTTDAIVADANADDMKIIGWEFRDGDAAGTQKQSHIQIAAATRPVLKDIQITGDFATGPIENGTAWIDALLENVNIDNANASPTVAVLLQATSSGSMRNCTFRVASGTTYVTANNDMQFYECYGTGTDATAAEKVGTALAGDLEGIIGNVDTAAATGAVTNTDTLMAYVKQLVTMVGVDADTNPVSAMMSGTAGIATMPNAAVPANGVNMFELLREIWAVLNGTAAGENGVQAFPAAAAPANNVSLAEVMREIYDQAEKSISTPAAVIANGAATIFTIAGGPIEVIELLSVCVTANDGTATTLKYTSDPTDGAATDVSAASASLASVAAGTTVLCTGTFASAATVTTNGTVAGGTTKFTVTAGVLQAITATGPTTGTWTHHLRYKPLARGVTVS